MANPSIASNRTRSILHAAKEGKYAVGAYNCYNCDGVMAVIRAAETKRSPAIIQLFPWTLHFQGPEFVRYVVNSAHAASVPIAVHLDHCIKPEDVELALTLPFDSIMIDGSTMEEAENVAICAQYIKRAHELGISIEVEMGRIEGGEDGLPNVDLGTIFTNPEDAKRFMEETGADFLAPSFWQYSRRLRTCLSKISKTVEQPLVLHGTHPVEDDLFLKAIDCGVSKINVNRTVRDDYTKFVAENAGKLELTVLKVQAVDVYSKSVQRVMDLFRCSGKA
ncbi:ketose-bisphosphate aldolase [Aspergillus pseudocaelatus]|uniref:Fructose-bisphosphate aldolase n=1 Tax=Aspergillus pseudocaelatus TaxID=1825620 RepID=A0ABQ6X0H8_9EURO|nr:ketose-bisphosphate aldolase [Aspergillus pseudocaelatus]